MGSRVTSAGLLARRPALAGAGAAGSLLAAVAVVALIAPGIVGFDGWSVAPRPGSEGSLRVEAGATTGPLLAAPAASATSAPTAVPGAGARAAPRRPATSGGPSVTGNDLAAGPGSGWNPARPVAAVNRRPPAGCQCGDQPVTWKESLARTTEGAGGGVGERVDRTGAVGGDAVSRFDPSWGVAARRAAATAAEGSRRSGRAAGDGVRDLPGGALRPPTLAPREIQR